MLPMLANDNCRYTALGDTEQFTYGVLCHALGVQAADLAYLLFGQARKSAAFAGVTIRAATLIHHVRDVLFLSTREQMGFVVHAPSQIAMMQDKKIIGDKTVLQFKGEAVCPGLQITDPESAIAIGEKSASPDPTRTEFWAMLRDWAVLVNLSPKASFNIGELRSRKVSGEKSVGLTLQDAVLNVLTGSNVRRLATAAFTQLRGFGYNVHVLAPYPSEGQSRSRYERLPGLFVPNSTPNYTTSRTHAHAHAGGI